MTNHQEIKKGIKQVELDKGVFNISVFFAVLFGFLSGIIAGIFGGAGWGFAVGLIIFFAIGIPAGQRYYEIDQPKEKA